MVCRFGRIGGTGMPVIFTSVRRIAVEATVAPQQNQPLFFRHVHRSPICPVCDAFRHQQQQQQQGEPAAAASAAAKKVLATNEEGAQRRRRSDLSPTLPEGRRAEASARDYEIARKFDSYQRTLNSLGESAATTDVDVDELVQASRSSSGVPPWVGDPTGELRTTSGQKAAALRQLQELMTTMHSGGGSAASIATKQPSAVSQEEQQCWQRFLQAGTAADLTSHDYAVLEGYLDKLRELGPAAESTPQPVRSLAPAATCSEEEEVAAKQARFQSALFDVSRVLDLARIPYFLCCGTALGAVREQRFIPHDNDIDIGAFYRDLGADPADTICQLLVKVAQDTAGALMCIDVLGEIDFGLEIRLIHRPSGVLVDFNLYYDSADPRCTRQQPATNQPVAASAAADDEPFVWCATHYEGSQQKKYGMYRYRHTPFVPKPITFCGRTFRVPPRKYFDEYFGSDWLTPKRFTYNEGLAGEYKNIIVE